MEEFFSSLFSAVYWGKAEPSSGAEDRRRGPGLVQSWWDDAMTGGTVDAPCGCARARGGGRDCAAGNC